MTGSKALNNYPEYQCTKNPSDRYTISLYQAAESEIQRF